jgi:hypothetical protein
VVNRAIAPPREMEKRSATTSQRAESRAHRRETEAVRRVLQGAAVRPAARAAHMPRSTLHGRAMRAAARANGKEYTAPRHKPDLTPEEEGVVVEMLVHFADRAVPLTRNDVADAVAVLVDRMDEIVERNSNSSTGFQEKSSCAVSRVAKQILFGLVAPQSRRRFVILLEMGMCSRHT